METKHFENEKAISFEAQLSSEVKQKIENWKATNTFFGVFPIDGNSMTCEDSAHSIPHNSKVLAYDLQIDCGQALANIWFDIPKNEILLLKGKTASGKDFFVCKTISAINAVTNQITLRSLNPEHKNRTIPFQYVSHIYKVVESV